MWPLKHQDRSDYGDKKLSVIRNKIVIKILLTVMKRFSLHYKNDRTVDENGPILSLFLS